MTNFSPAEIYTEKLLGRLSSLYTEYNKELQIIKSLLGESSPEVLETFINIEQHRFQQISSVERVLKIHYKGCSIPFKNCAEKKLRLLREKAHSKNDEISKIINREMDRIRTELSSIRFPARAKNYRQESAPVLIDIVT